MDTRFTNGKRTHHLSFLRRSAFLGLLVLTSMSGKAQTTALQTSHVHNIVLVHGAWADGSSWNKLILLLETRGFHVTAVHLPFTTLADDVATVKRTLALQDGPSWSDTPMAEL